ncbi:MAG: T9SS type A sorting domain-containing protein [Flavobacteriales bacterium]|nr:T9SS type A sorting domain-containing protein [Flavobacteriales bacterium]
MKRTCILSSAFVALLLGSPIAKAQQTYFLNVDSIIGIPDTIYDGSTVTFTMVFSNVSNLGFQGDVETWLQVPGTADSTQADSTQWTGNNFIQAQSQTQVTVTHLFTSQNNSLAIGDNVVVVWPRISSGPSYPPQEVITKGMVDFYLAEPLGIGPGKDQSLGRLGLYPNPTQGSVRLSLPDNETLTYVRITDMMGRTVLELAQVTASLGIEGLPHGIYTVHATTANGASYTARMVVRP